MLGLPSLVIVLLCQRWGVLIGASHIVAWAMPSPLLFFVVIACRRTNMKHRNGEAVQSNSHIEEFNQ